MRNVRGLKAGVITIAVVAAVAAGFGLRARLGSQTPASPELAQPSAAPRAGAGPLTPSASQVASQAAAPSTSTANATGPSTTAHEEPRVDPSARFPFEKDAEVIASVTRPFVPTPANEADEAGSDETRAPASAKPAQSTRVQVLRTQLKYPLMRVVERIDNGDGSSAPVVTQRVAMVADHAVVQLSAGHTEEDLRRVAAEAGFSIRRSMPFSKAYLVSFKGEEVDAVEHAIETLEASGVVASAEPDMYVSVR